MRTKLQSLPDAERAEVEQASSILRKMRASRAAGLDPHQDTGGDLAGDRPLLPLTVANSADHAPGLPRDGVTASARTTGMIGARRRDSEAKRARVLATIERMLSAGTPITVAAVARQAKVSTWLVYAPGLREAITDARYQQLTQHLAEPAPDPAERGLRTDLALARAEITRLRAQRDQQRQQIRLALGARLDDIAKADLVARVDELTRHNSELTATAAQLRADNQTVQTRVSELEDDLAAARTSLRRMIRTENRPAAT